MNKNIKTEIALGIIVMVALTFGGILWVRLKKQQCPTIQQSPHQNQTVVNTNGILEQNESAVSKAYVYVENGSSNKPFEVPVDFYNPKAGGVNVQTTNNPEELYVVRTIDPSNPGGNPQYELWRYNNVITTETVGGPQVVKWVGTKLYSSEFSIDFKVSPNEKYIAIITNDGNDLIFTDAEGNEIRKYDAKGLGYIDEQGNPLGFDFFTSGYVSGLGWSADEGEFWGQLTPGMVGDAEPIYKIDTQSWKITKYNFPSFPNPSEWDFNMPKRKIAYSNCPLTLDSYSADEFNESKQKVNLYIYDIETGTQQIIESATAKCFEPKWLRSDIIEYNSPTTSGRAFKIIN